MKPPEAETRGPESRPGSDGSGQRFEAVTVVFAVAVTDGSLSEAARRVTVAEGAAPRTREI
jgi:hypothetical protein